MEKNVEISVCGFWVGFRDVTSKVENHIESNMEHEMETEIIYTKTLQIPLIRDIWPLILRPE